jgi:hypothetical protein
VIDEPVVYDPPFGSETEEQFWQAVEDLWDWWVPTDEDAIWAGTQPGS